MSGSFNPPANPTVGQIYSFGGSTWRWSGTAWENASTGANFVATTGSTMTGPLVLSGNAPASAPLQAVPLQQVAVAIAAAPDNVGRNLLHNGLFNISQRGGGPWTATGTYTADRWLMVLANDAASISLVTGTDADRAAIGDEAMLTVLQNVFTGSATANSFNLVNQRAETVRRLSGKQVTYSFYAVATSGTPRLGVSAAQIFGTGGSPSPTVTVPFGTTPPLSATCTRYTLSATLPSASGKTYGTTLGTDYTQFNLWFSDTSNQAGQSTSIGQQSGTVKVWGIQLEIGSVATPLEKLDPQQDLANCQRFYQVINGVTWGGYVGSAGPVIYAPISLPVEMRAAPSGAMSGAGGSGTSGIGYNNTTPTAVSVQAATTAAGGVWAQANLLLTADL